MSRARPVAVSEHWNRVGAMGCIVPGCNRRPVTISHSHGGSMKDRGIHKGKAQKTSDYLVLPICHHHHVGAEGLDIIGVLTWEQRFGRQADMLDQLVLILGYDVWQLAALEHLEHAKSRKFKRCSSRKIIKRPYG